MAAEAYERVLAVQELDLAVSRLRHQAATHPLHEELAVAMGEHDRVAGEVDSLDGELHQLERDLKRLADEVAGIEAKRADIDSKLYGGSVTASKELLALQDEAAALLERQRQVEDDELEIMERQEELGARRSKGAEGLAAAAAAVDGSEAALAEATTDLEVEIARLTGERDEAAAQVPAVLLGRYEELAGQYGGVAVARYVDGRCDGCHIQLSAVARDQLTRAAEDAVVNCEECGRLLVR